MSYKKYKLSEMILMGVGDLEWAENHPDYKINMGVWHEPQQLMLSRDHCSVCFAGSVIARKSRRPLDSLVPESKKEWRQLMALDDVRKYNLIAAYNHIEHESKYLERKIIYYFQNYINNSPTEDTPLYGINPELFKENMIYIAMTLDAFGF